MCCFCLVEEGADVSCLLLWVDRVVRSFRYAVSDFWHCLTDNSHEPLGEELV
jgi:hypothetical protein